MLAALQRLVHDLGVTVVMAEHRLERVVQYADRVIEVPGGSGPVQSGEPVRLMATAPVAPPVVQLGRLAGWSPLPLSVRDARRAAGALRTRLDGAVPLRAGVSTGVHRHVAGALPGPRGALRHRTVALRGVTLEMTAGEVVALMGRNGAGKSTLLNALVGLVTPVSGAVDASGLTPVRTKPKDLVKAVGLVPQEPADLLYAATVARRVRAGGRRLPGRGRYLPCAAGPAGARDRRRHPSA